jgi:NDP-sugar pyrophosphorylase family protein
MEDCVIQDVRRIRDSLVGRNVRVARGDSLPASVQLVAKPGADGLVLAAGGRLASLIRGTAERGRLPTTT